MSRFFGSLWALTSSVLLFCASWASTSRVFLSLPGVLLAPARVARVGRVCASSFGWGIGAGNSAMRRELAGRRGQLLLSYTRRSAIAALWSSTSVGAASVRNTRPDTHGDQGRSVRRSLVWRICPICSDGGCLESDSVVFRSSKRVGRGGVLDVTRELRSGQPALRAGVGGVPGVSLVDVDLWR